MGGPGRYNPLLNCRQHPTKNIRWRYAERFPYRAIYEVTNRKSGVGVARGPPRSALEEASMSHGQFIFVAAEVTRLISISDFRLQISDVQSEPPHVRCYGARKGVEK